ncbi:hypothetical protein [Kitasatospora sp. NPDC057015]|uniref:hypothetical protein n=1 Tax=Kitasatospora sp. NPDC057015 TaxID=3346001 RepID=UPI00362B1E1D
MKSGGRSDGFDFASATLAGHIGRGVLGFGSIVGSIVLVGVVGPVALVLLPAGLFALRGCPMCWAVGLMQTVSRGRLQRGCENGRCTLTVAGRGRDHEGAAV